MESNKLSYHSSISVSSTQVCENSQNEFDPMYQESPLPLTHCDGYVNNLFVYESKFDTINEWNLTLPDPFESTGLNEEPTGQIIHELQPFIQPIHEVKYEPPLATVAVEPVDVPSDYIFEQAVREAPSELFLELSSEVAATHQCTQQINKEKDSSSRVSMTTKSTVERKSAGERKSEKRKRTVEKGTPEHEVQRANNKKAAQKHNAKKKREAEEKMRLHLRLENENVQLRRMCSKLEVNVLRLHQYLANLSN